MDSLGMLETTGLTPAVAALDAMEKTAGVRLLQAEVNDMLGICFKIQGAPDAVTLALQAGYELAATLGGQPVTASINRPDEDAWQVIDVPREYNPLIQQDVVWIPQFEATSQSEEESNVAKPAPDALGLIETQGFTAVFQAIDTACKAAQVEVVGKEKLGGGYVTVVIQGDVAAVRAAVDAGQGQVAALGKLIAAHVISRPSENVLKLLPS